MAKSSAFELVFVDGTECTVSRRPVHFMRAESISGKDPLPNTYVLATLWAAHTGGHGTRNDFEDWAESLESWEVASVDADADPPAKAPGTSLD